MGIESIEYARFIFGIFLMILPGYLCSLLIFKKMNVVERVAFGFGFSLVISSLIVMLFSLLIKITPFFLFLFFGIYIAIPIPFLVANKKNFSFSLPSKKGIIKAIILIGILIFVFYMTFLPHSVNKYYLPLHADEWVHWGYIHGFINSGHIKFPNPFTGGSEAIPPEIGFHVFLASFKYISGASLKTIFLLMPSLLAIFTSLAAFCLGERSKIKFGLEASFLAAFIPTNVRFLGPSFLIPLSLGLFLALFSLLLAERRGYKKYALIFLLILFTALAHPPSAVAMAIVLLCYSIFLAMEKKYKEAGFIALVTFIPFLVAYFIIPTTYFEMGINAIFGEEYISRLPKVMLSLSYLGKVTWGLFFLASFIAIYKGKALQRGIFLSALAFISIIFLYDKYNFGLPIIYDRSFSYLFLFVTVLAGYGLAGIREYGEKGIKYVGMKLEKFFGERKDLIAKGFGIAIVIALCLIIAFYAIPVHKGEPYYKIINEKEFERFEWIRCNIDDYKDEYHSFEKAAIDPIKASIFSAVTGIHTISSTFWPKYGEGISKEMNTFLAGKGKDIDFLEKHDLSVIYGECENKNLEKIYKNVYLYYGLPPRANFTFIPEEAEEGEAATFISTSTTPYGEIINWSWNLGDGNISNGKIDGLYFKEGNARARMEMNRSFTIEMWLCPNFSYDDGKTHEWFLWYGGGTYIDCFKHWNNRVYFVVKGKEWRAASLVIKFDANTWHHFVGMYNGWSGSFTIYWDGKIVKFTTGGGVISSEKGTAIIGGRNNRWFDGWIKEVRIYGRALNDSELMANYNGNVTTKGLIAWWKFDEGFGNIAHDIIGNNNATVYGAMWVNYVEHAYSKAGEYKVTLTVMNDKGLTDSISKKIFVS